MSFKTVFGTKESIVFTAKTNYPINPEYALRALSYDEMLNTGIKNVFVSLNGKVCEYLFKEEWMKQSFASLNFTNFKLFNVATKNFSFDKSEKINSLFVVESNLHKHFCISKYIESDDGNIIYYPIYMVDNKLVFVIHEGEKYILVLKWSNHDGDIDRTISFYKESIIGKYI
jgi:hypothetical protein